MEVLDDSEPDWWRVRHLRTGEEGFIPWNFVAPEKSIEGEECVDPYFLYIFYNNNHFFFFYCSWFFGKISRKEAERLLMAEENPRGTFLVRNSEHNRNGYSLSVKDWEEARGYHPKHYMIKPLDNGGYYIATNQTFPSLPSLVMAYSSAYFNIGKQFFVPFL